MGEGGGMVGREGICELGWFPTHYYPPLIHTCSPFPMDATRTWVSVALMALPAALARSIAWGKGQGGEVEFPMWRGKVSPP